MAGPGEASERGSYPFLAFVMSIAVHCGIAALFVACFGKMAPEPFPPKIISVEIHALRLPEEEAQPPSGPQRSASPLPLPVKAPMPKKMTPPPEPMAKPAPPSVPPLPPEPLANRKSGGSDSAPIVRGVHEESAPAAKEYVKSGNTGDSAPRGGPETSASGANPGVVELRPDSAYLASLRALIEKHKDYPVIARRGRMEGTCLIGCELTRTGRLGGARVIRSSGHSLLDNAALRAVKSVGVFPEVPADIKGEKFIFSVPITYRLVNN